eukprot:1627558-Prorocentrum_lima.AAC.1
MTSSLVGSEMCIRDSPWGSAAPADPDRPPTQESHAWDTPPPKTRPAAVSYTHLTLPTICSV